MVLSSSELTRLHTSSGLFISCFVFITELTSLGNKIFVIIFHKAYVPQFFFSFQVMPEVTKSKKTVFYILVLYTRIILLLAVAKSAKNLVK